MYNASMQLVYILLGVVSLAIGVLGTMMPVLPAFPFILLAAYFFGRSSKKLSAWFLNTNLYKANLKTWTQRRGMTAAAKARVLGVVTLSLAIGFVVMGDVLIGRIIVALVWVGHLIYFLGRVKTLPPEAAKTDTRHDELAPQPPGLAEPEA